MEEVLDGIILISELKHKMRLWIKLPYSRDGLLHIQILSLWRRADLIAPSKSYSFGRELIKKKKSPVGSWLGIIYEARIESKWENE